MGGGKMKAQEIRGLRVIEAERGDTLGTIKGVIIDLDKRHLVALEVSSGLLSQPSILPLSNIKTLEQDAVMVPTSQSFINRRDLGFGGLTDSLAGRSVLTEDGRRLGDVRDYSFDSQSGQITSIIFGVDKEVLGGLWKKAGDEYEISIDHVLTLGENIIVENSVPDEVGLNKAA
jgi:sporulation protein YlmC with PRC-barrel domain